jgi:hypothetical protein
MGLKRFLPKPWNTMKFIQYCPDGLRGNTGYIGIPPHFRIYRLVYSKYLDFAFMSQMKHLCWRFWWVSK